MSFDQFNGYAATASATWNHHAATFQNYPTHAPPPVQHAAGAMPQRSPATGQALALGFGSLLVPVLGPMAWMHAGEELGKMQTGEVRAVDQSLLQTAKALGILSSVLAASATLMLVLFAVLA